jgi:hypothetical protein
MKAALIAGAAMLAGCGETPGEGDLTSEDNRELANAAEMMDVPSDSLVANEEMLLGNGEEEIAEEGEVAVSNTVLTNAAANGQ